MSKTKQSTAPRSPAPTAPAPRREVVVNVNKNVLFAIALVLGALVMLGGGFFIGQALFRPHTSSDAVAQTAPGASNLPDSIPSDVQGAPSGLQVKPAPSDPNALHPNLEGFVPVSPSAVPVNDGEARLAVEGIDDKATYDMGDVKSGDKKVSNFTIKNVGKADLVINQMYTSCGCTLAEFAGRQVTDDPFVPPIVIKPGESQPLNITYDPKVIQDEGKVDKFVQIFSNDPTAKKIEGEFKETRFRLTANVLPAQ
ncbi:MAG: DUF1573 domain-containing protein [Anaerolineae bacterium]